MYKHTKTKSDDILRLYKEGRMLTEITRLTSSSQPTVKKVLSQFGIDYDEERKRSREKALNQVLELYKLGKSQCYIEKELNLTRKTIRDLLYSAGVNYRTKADQHHLRYKTQVDHHAFDKLTPEALYWIGMLYTDGHIEEKKEASVELTLHTQDKEHLEKLRRFLGASRQVSRGNGDTVRLRINSKAIRDRLVALGFTANKSTSITPHDMLKESRDFWRGCIDGDGGIYWRKDNTGHVTLCGTGETVLEFALYCSKYAGAKEKLPFKAPGNNHYAISYYGTDARKIADLLYKDATVYLERKYQVYQESFLTPPSNP